VKKGQNGRKSLRRIIPIVGCNASKRRRNDTNRFNLLYTANLNICLIHVEYKKTVCYSE
jgi:hypothetical protein